MESAVDPRRARPRRLRGLRRAAYDEEILERLAALSHERVEEGRRNRVRWLHPDFQNPGRAKAAKGSLDAAGLAAAQATAKPRKAVEVTAPESPERRWRATR